MVGYTNINKSPKAWVLKIVPVIRDGIGEYEHPPPKNVGAKNHTRDTGRDIQTQTNYHKNTGIKNHTLLCGWIYKQKQVPKIVGAKHSTNNTKSSTQTKTSRSKKYGY